MANPTKITYKLPTAYVGDAPLPVADIQSVDLGLRPASGTAGTYPLTATDVTFTADAQGISTEPLAAFGMLSPGSYVAAGRTRTKAGGVSTWSVESPPFTIEPPVPNPPSNFGVA